MRHGKVPVVSKEPFVPRYGHHHLALPRRDFQLVLTKYYQDAECGRLARLDSSLLCFPSGQVLLCVLALAALCNLGFEAAEIARKFCVSLRAIGEAENKRSGGRNRDKC